MSDIMTVRELASLLSKIPEDEKVYITGGGCDNSAWAALIAGDKSLLSFEINYNN